MVCISEVELSENCGRLKLLFNGVDKGKGILILDGDVIQPPIINTGPQSLVLLGNKKEACPYW